MTGTPSIEEHDIDHDAEDVNEDDVPGEDHEKNDKYSSLIWWSKWFKLFIIDSRVLLIVTVWQFFIQKLSMNDGKEG